MEIDYKHIELTVRGGIVHGKAFYTFHGSSEHHWATHVSKSEAEVLANINKQIKDRATLLDSLNKE